MKKMFNKAVLNGTTVMGDGLTYPRIPNVYTGDNEGGYQRGDIMDANAVVEMIKELTDTGEITIEELQNLINEEIQERVEGDQDQQRYTDEKIKDLIGTSPETLDTLKEIADALGEDPDFAANVWNKIAELTTKHNEDVQELQDAITSGFENIDFTPYVKKTDVVTDTTNGLMLASDKVKLDAFEEAEQYAKAVNLPSIVLKNISRFGNDPDRISLELKKIDLYSNIENFSYIDIYGATSSRAGVMTAPDKVKLNGIEEGAQVNVIESVSVNGTPLEVTDKGVNVSFGDGINIAEGVISTIPISIKTEKLSFEGRNNYGKYYTCSGVTIYDDRYISGTKYGIAFDANNIKCNTIITSPDGVKTVYFEFSNTLINKINSIGEKENKIYVDNDSYLTYYTASANKHLDIKDDIKKSIDSISGKQDALTEAQLNNINNAITSISVNDIEQVNTNGAVDLIIPTVSKDADGLVPAYQNNNGSIGLKILGVNSKTNSDTGETEYNLGWKKFTIKQGSEHVFIGNVTSFDPLDNVLEGEGVFIRPATSTYAGIMTPEDKAKLDSQPTIKASDATGVTDDDYVVIKKSEYQSILDRLSALENNA